MNIQAKLNYKTAALKRHLFDNAIRKKSLDVRAVRLTITEDKYNNKDVQVFDHGTLDIIISIPGGDLQAFNGERTNNETYNSGLGIYSILPIEAWSTTDADINKDDLLIYKILLTPLGSSVQETMLQVFQVANKLVRADNTVLYNKLILAPYTFSMEEYPTVESIIAAYQMEPIII